MTRTSNTFSILIAAQLHSFFQHFRVKESQHLYTEDEIAKLLLLTVSNTNEVV